MVKLKIQNFGPIKSGFSQNNGFMEIMPVTVVIGNQAAARRAGNRSCRRGLVRQ